MGPKRGCSEGEVSARRQGLGEELEVGAGGGAWVGLGLGVGDGYWEVELRGSRKRQMLWGRKGVMEKRAEPVPVRHQCDKQSL